MNAGPSEQPSPGQLPPGRRPSGLRNPTAAVRGLGAGTLVMEAVVLLLAIAPLRALGELTGATLGTVLGLVVAAAIVAGLLRRPWAWHAGTAVQILLALAGLLHWSLGVLGVVFGLVWVYVLHVRRTILR